MTRKKSPKPLKILPFHEAWPMGLAACEAEMKGRVKPTSLTAFKCRVKSFVHNEYDPTIGLEASINLYLKRLVSLQKSPSYIRLMKSVLERFKRSLSTCQFEIAGGDWSCY